MFRLSAYKWQAEKLFMHLAKTHHSGFALEKLRPLLVCMGTGMNTFYILHIKIKYGG